MLIKIWEEKFCSSWMEVRKEMKRKRNSLPENESLSPKTQKIQNQAMAKWNIFIDKITQKPF